MSEAPPPGSAGPPHRIATRPLDAGGEAELDVQLVPDFLDAAPVGVGEGRRLHAPAAPTEHRRIVTATCADIGAQHAITRR
jgi:hypothetical protein